MSRRSTKQRRAARWRTTEYRAQEGHPGIVAGMACLQNPGLDRRGIVILSHRAWRRYIAALKSALAAGTP